MQHPEPFFVSDTECDSLKTTILELVTGFYKEISSLICTYLDCGLQIGQLLDVYDETGIWRIGCVVGRRTNYVGIHYNDYECRYDDWIYCGSFRLAPLHTYCYYQFRSDFSRQSKHYKWGKTIYNKFMSSISAGYNDRLTSTWVSECIFKYNNYDPSKAPEQNLNEIVATLQLLNQSLRANSHTHLFQCQCNNLETYKPGIFHENIVLDRKELEKQAREHHEATPVFKHEDEQKI